jgi:hypothetical protein
VRGRTSQRPGIRRAHSSQDDHKVNGPQVLDSVLQSYQVCDNVGKDLIKRSFCDGLGGQKSALGSGSGVAGPHDANGVGIPPGPIQLISRAKTLLSDWGRLSKSESLTASVRDEAGSSSLIRRLHGKRDLLLAGFMNSRFSTKLAGDGAQTIGCPPNAQTTTPGFSSLSRREQNIDLAE